MCLFAVTDISCGMSAIHLSWDLFLYMSACRTLVFRRLRADIYKNKSLH